MSLPVKPVVSRWLPPVQPRRCVCNTSSGPPPAAPRRLPGPARPCLPGSARPSPRGFLHLLPAPDEHPRAEHPRAEAPGTDERASPSREGRPPEAGAGTADSTVFVATEVATFSAVTRAEQVLCEPSRPGTPSARVAALPWLPGRRPAGPRRSGQLTPHRPVFSGAFVTGGLIAEDVVGGQFSHQLSDQSAAR